MSAQSPEEWQREPREAMNDAARAPGSVAAARGAIALLGFSVPFPARPASLPSCDLPSVLSVSSFSD